MKTCIKCFISIIGFFLRPFVSSKIVRSTPERIGILLWGCIGNHILFSPVIYGIREKYPDAEIAIISFYGFAREMYGKTADKFFFVCDEPFYKSMIKLQFFLRRFHPDIVISNAMSPVFLSSLIAYLSGAKIRIGIEQGHRGFLNNIRVYERKEHEVIENLRIAKRFLVNVENLPLAVDYSDFDEKTAVVAFNNLHFNRDFPVVAIQPGSGKHHSFMKGLISGRL